MAKCEACGDDYDKSFEVVARGKTYAFDSFGCAIHALAPTCAPCGVRIIGHGLKDLMSRDVKVISPDMTIKDAARKMRDGDFGMMPVGEDDRLVGTVSDRDVVTRAVAESKDAGTNVRDAMSEGIVWAYEDDFVEQAAKIMASASSINDMSASRRGGLRSHQSAGGRTLVQLRNEATQRAVKRRSSMNKAQLGQALQR